MTSLSKESRGAVVLCGGGSMRMGRDKALLPFGDEVLLQRTVRLVGEVVPEKNIVVAAAADQALPQLPPAIKVIRDEAPGLGPLPAIAAGLQALIPAVAAAFVTGCDAPLLKPAAVAWLFEQLGPRDENERDGVLLQDAERLYPLFAVYRTSAAVRLAAAFRSGGQSLHGAITSALFNVRLLDLDDVRMVDPQLDSLVNCNTMEEFKAAQDRIEISSTGGGPLAFGRRPSSP